MLRRLFFTLGSSTQERQPAGLRREKTLDIMSKKVFLPSYKSSEVSA